MNQETDNLNQEEVLGMNLDDTDVPKKGEPFSQEMYEELEQRVAAF